ncbi:MAG: hypothetical protein ACI85Q_000347 [Salibacteraceae bacterium]
MTNTPSHKAPFPWYILPLSAILLLYVWNAFFFEIHDFSNYYFSAKMVLNGAFNSDIYFPEYFNKWAATNFGDFYFMSYAPNTPFLAFFYVPFALFPIALSKLLFNFLSIGLCIHTVVRLKNHFSIPNIWVFVFPFIFFIAIKNNLLFGQPYFLVIFLLSEGLLAYSKEQIWKSSIFWGLAIAIKLFPLIIIGFLISKRAYKSALYLGISTLLIVSISVVFIGLETWFFWMEQVIPRFNMGEIAGPFVDNYQSLFMFCKRLFVYDCIKNPSGLGNYMNTIFILLLGFKFFILGTTFYISRKELNLLFSFGIWFLAGITISPYGSSYSLITLTFLFLSLYQPNFQNRFKIGASLGLTVILFGSLSSSFSFPFNYLRLAGLLFTVLFICKLYWSVRNFQKVTIFALIVMGLSTLLSKNKTTNSHLIKPTPILTFDYTIHNNQLICKYWNKNGLQKTTIPLSIESQTVTGVYIKNHQVFYKDRQLTFTPSNKKNARLINGHQIIYLSDEVNGIGFYQLRITDIEQ